MPISGYAESPMSLKQTVSANDNFNEPNESTEWNYRLVVENKPIYVNRKFLSAISPVFNKMFFDPKFTDANTDEIVMKEKTHSEFLEFIHVIAVTFDVKPKRKVNEENLHILLSYADEYQIGSLTESCVKYIKKHMELPIGTKRERQRVEDLFCLVYQHSMTQLVERLLPRIARFPYDEIKAIDKRSELDRITFFKITDLKLVSYSEKENERRRLNTYKKEFLQVRARHHCPSCAECGTNKSAQYNCADCTAGMSTAYFCEPCFDAVHVAKQHTHAQMHCRTCQGVFLMSTHTEPDTCACL